MPGLKSVKYGSGDPTWLLHTDGIRYAITGVAKATAFTKATHYPDGYLPSGLILNIADTSQLKPYTGAAGEVFGCLDGDHPFDGSEDVNVAALYRGAVKTDLLPVQTGLPTTAPANWLFTKDV